MTPTWLTVWLVIQYVFLAVWFAVLHEPAKALYWMGAALIGTAMVFLR